MWKHCLILLSLTLGAAGMTQTMYDPVTLENPYLKLTVDLGRGATLRSMVDKINNAETAREFLTGGEYCGALAEDRLAGEGYPGEITRLKYTGKTRTEGNTRILEASCRPENPKYAGLEFTKIFRLADHARFVEVEWRITNHKPETYAVTPWVHNIVNKDYVNTVLPKPDGVKLIPPSADYFQDPTRNWFGGYNPDSKRLIYFSTDYRQTLKNYYCYWNGYHCLEWTFQPAPLEPGKTWSGTYHIGLAEPFTVPAAAIPEAVAAWQWVNGKLAVEITPAVNWGATEIGLSAGGKLPPVTADFRIGKAIRFELTAEQLDGADLLTVTLPGSKTLAISIDPAGRTDVLNTALAPWEPPQSPYRKIEPRKLAGRQISPNVWQVNHFEKIFEYDTFEEAPFQPDVRAPRNSRIYDQFVLHNPTDKELVFPVKPVVLRADGAVLPATLRTVGYIATTEPSGFTMTFPVGRYPDPLLEPGAKLVVPPGKNLPVWIEVFVPPAQKPGLYEGVAELGDIRLPLRCQVLDITLPARSSLRTTVGCWSPSPGLLKEVGYQGTPAEFQKKCRELYYRHRLTPRENGVGWTFNQAMDEQLNELRENHATSIAVPAFVVKNPETLKKAGEVLKKHNLLEQAFFYTIDEAPADRFPEVIDLSKQIHRVLPELKILGTIYEKDVSPLYGYINIWCRHKISEEPWFAERRKAGDEFMSSNLPGMVLERDGVAPVLPFLLLKQHRFSGFLYWNMIGGYGKDNPWKNILCAGSNGGAHLLYPHADGPIETTRWKHLAYGVELFDLLSMLEAKDADACRSLLKNAEAIGSYQEIELLKSRILNSLTAE
jgi:hypothetical protein